MKNVLNFTLVSCVHYEAAVVRHNSFFFAVHFPISDTNNQAWFEMKNAGIYPQDEDWKLSPSYHIPKQIFWSF